MINNNNNPPRIASKIIHHGIGFFFCTLASALMVVIACTATEIIRMGFLEKQCYNRNSIKEEFSEILFSLYSIDVNKCLVVGLRGINNLRF